MKNINLFVLLAVFPLMFFNSCDGDDIEDYLGKRKTEDILEWQYSLPAVTNSGRFTKETPAVDEDDNIYVFSYVANGDIITSLTKNGSLRWEANIGDSGNVISRIAYKSGKLFFISHNDDYPVVNFLSCYNSENGSKEWRVEISGDCNAFSVVDDGIITITDDNINYNYHVTKFDFNGIITANTDMELNYSENFTLINSFRNDVYIMGEFGNTSIAHIFKYSFGGSYFTKEWDLDLAENNNSADFAIDGAGNIYVMTNGYFYSISSSGTVNWKNNEVDIYDMEIRTNPVLTDSTNILLSYSALFKLNPAGVILWKNENENAGAVIGKNKKYYMIESYQGPKCVNTDGSIYWYSSLNISTAYPAMLHNGNLVYIYEREVYCINTEAGGLDEAAEWPKIYFDYGNTSCKK
ncbi:MAG: PQQ-binding-like beta-propeller repeat protein [Chlorobi bacterium]|nr:PQQ-binding-like beta-propeller repeat protein [Chlorobiota bacterium]